MIYNSPFFCSKCGKIDIENTMIYLGGETKHPLNQKIKTPEIHCSKCQNNIDISYKGKIENYYNIHDKKSPKLIIINGPSGSHKTSISHLISKEYNYIQIDGEGLRFSLSKKIKKILSLNEVHVDILFMIEIILNLGRDIVVSTTIESDYWQLYNYFFQEKKIPYILITLLPEYKYLSLDKKQYNGFLLDDDYREKQYQSFVNSNDLKFSFYDNSGETSEQTVLNLLNMYLIQNQLLILQNQISKNYCSYFTKV